MLIDVAVCDISAIRSRFILDLVSGGKITSKIIIPEEVINSIRREVKKGNYLILENFSTLKSIAEQVGVNIEIIREDRKVLDDEESVLHVAMSNNYPLITSNENLAKIAKAMGIEVLYGKATKIQGEPIFVKYFNENVMSVHLKEGLMPRGKVGRPGSWQLQTLENKVMDIKELEKIIEDIFERVDEEGFIELDRESSKILMLRNYRIIITYPPFSDRLELTITKKLVDLEIEDYNLSPKLIKRLKERAEGILIAGAPGMGKTTFARALAKFYLRENKIIKTIESPRDLCLPPTVTQYSKSKVSSEELHDVLLLSRPDYTFFDEMRDTEDFKIFTDLRLAGVGMVGVVHAASPIDAIQRFIGRVELGMIPSIIDTVIFINKGTVEKVYELETKVKIPHGLTESDLTRPVLLVKDFETNEVEYEIYVFGERTFVIPLKTKKEEKIIESMILKLLERYLPIEEVTLETNDKEVIINIPSNRINYIAKKCKRKIQRLEQKVGVKITLKAI